MNVDIGGGQGLKVQSTYVTKCKKAQEEALACVTDHPGDRGACESFFQAYRACRREEHNEILKSRGGERI